MIGKYCNLIMQESKNQSNHLDYLLITQDY